MALTSMLKQYLDAGVALTEVTRDRAEKIVKDLVDAGEVARSQATILVDDLVERSRGNAEALVAVVQGEVAKQLAVMQAVTKDAVDRLETQVAGLSAQVQGLLPDAVAGRLPTRKAAPKAVAATPARAAAAKATATKRPAAKKAATARKRPAQKKAAAKKSS